MRCVDAGVLKPVCVLLMRTAFEGLLGSGLVTYRPGARVDVRSPPRVAGFEFGGCWPGDLGLLAARLLLVNPAPWPEKRAAPAFKGCAGEGASAWRGREGEAAALRPLPAPPRRVSSVSAGAHLLGLFSN